MPDTTIPPYTFEQAQQHLQRLRATGVTREGLLDLARRVSGDLGNTGVPDRVLDAAYKLDNPQATQNVFGVKRVML
jgi:hypothetical protein